MKAPERKTEATSPSAEPVTMNSAKKVGSCIDSSQKTHAMVYSGMGGVVGGTYILENAALRPQTLKNEFLKP